MERQDMVAWRKGLGISQEDAAASLGMSRRAYQAIENGETPIDTRTNYACQWIAAHVELVVPSKLRAPVKFEIVPYKGMAGFYVRMTWANGYQITIDNPTTNEPAFIDEQAAQDWIAHRSKDFLRSLPGHSTE